MSLKQSIINNFYKRKSKKQSDSESESDDDPVYLPSKQKRIYEQPMFWTRVKSIEIAASQRVTLFDVEQDLLMDKNLKQIRKDSVREPGTLMFDPESFKDTAD